MDLDFTVEQAEFRDEVRTWLAEHAPGEPRPHTWNGGMREYDLAWQRAQWEGGWAGISWPKEYGGRGLATLRQLIWYEEYAKAGLPAIDSTFVGLNHAGPTLITRAGEEQKAFHLPRILRGEDIWVDLLPSQEQLELAALAARFFADQLPVSQIRERRAEPAAITREEWSAAAELGLLGVSAAEDIGGLGLGLDDEVLLFRELGRQLVPGPFIASVLGARLAALAGDAGLARKIVAGDAVVALAQRRSGPELTAGSPLTGQFDAFDAIGTDYLLIVDPSGAGLVETVTADVIRPDDCIDPGTRLATVTADGAPVAGWVPAGAEPLRLRGLALASAVLVGIAQAVTDLAVEHAKNRVQFGRPIGVNQAVKHACVDMAVAAEAALQQTLFGAISLRSGRADAEFQVMAAKVVSGRAAVDNAAHCIQVHGGMGYTDEHNAHLYLKRAHVLDQFFGSSRDSLAAVLAVEAAG